MKKIAIIGAGASGIMAAIEAAKAGAEVFLIEKENKLAKKLLITGNGRCNMTNADLSLKHYHSSAADDLVKSVLTEFSLEETKIFFGELGLPLVEEKAGKFFPMSLNAASVVRLLEYQLEKLNVQLKLAAEVTKIQKEKNGFSLIIKGQKALLIDKVVLCCGSPAYPQVGGSDKGYFLAKQLGHRIVEPFPAILPLNIEEKYLRQLQGIKRDCLLTLFVNKQAVQQSFGELLFTKYGISGPAALNISRATNQAVLQKNLVWLELNFFPDYDDDEFFALLEKLWQDQEKSVVLSLTGLLRERIPQILLADRGYDQNFKVKDLSVKDRKRVIRCLRQLVLTPTKVRDFKEAVVAAGGLQLDEVDPQTLESKLCQGLYFAGEILDVDGDSGGYNLQFAWSSGFMAAKNACQSK